VHRVRILAALLATGLAAVGIAAGCGSGGDDRTSKEPPGTTAPVNQPAPPRLSAADRVAYRRLSAAAGALRAAVAPLGAGSAGAAIAGKRLRAHQRRVEATSPRAAELDSARTTLLAAIAAALADRPGPAAARNALEAAGRVDARLRDYAAAHPAANELIP
jgi:hypothetical protein